MLTYDIDNAISIQTWNLHPLREKADSRMVLSVPVIIAQDDVSGNESKAWNCHYNIYMNNGALPREQAQKDQNVHFVATSTFASPQEMMNCVRREVK